MTDPNFGCRWEYKGKDGWIPCQVKGAILHETTDGKSEVVGLIINTGVGPDIEAMLEELSYEVKKS